jgi:heat shock protein HtpX
MNYLRTAILLAGLTGLFMAVGYLIGGSGGTVIALIIAAATNLSVTGTSTNSSYRCTTRKKWTSTARRSLSQELAQRASLPMPRVYLMDSPQPNAFAT